MENLVRRIEAIEFDRRRRGAAYPAAVACAPLAIAACITGDELDGGKTTGGRADREDTNCSRMAAETAVEIKVPAPLRSRPIRQHYRSLFNGDGRGGFTTSNLLKAPFLFMLPTMIRPPKSPLPSHDRLRAAASAVPMALVPTWLRRVAQAESVASKDFEGVALAAVAVAAKQAGRYGSVRRSDCIPA